MADSLDITQATTKTEEIPSHRPDAKTRRYDRQLRLWASAGQRSLESARVLLVGHDATGAQALKNLVLPGISHFSILSPSTTTAQDVATNFFLHPTDVGSSIAESIVKYLKELNPAVDGAARVEDTVHILDNDPEFFASYTLIICSNVDPSVELRIAELLWKASETTGGADIPLMSIRSSGFIGRIEIQLREHCVVDTHPESSHSLRIDQPFPALEKYARELNLDNMDSMEHSHVPFVVLLVKAAAEWKDSHEGKLPEYEQKDEFKKFLNLWRKKSDEENFDEADNKAYYVTQKTEIPFNVQDLLQQESVKSVSSGSKNVHILLHALGEYLKTRSLPPISPTLPDMHSSTTAYIALQNLYKDQHRSDLAKYKSVLAAVLERLGMSADIIPEEEVESFVKNSSAVAIIKGASMRESKQPGEKLQKVLDQELNKNFGDELFIAEHLAFLASERFYAENSRWPGDATNGVEADQQQLERIVQGVVDANELPDVAADAIAEIVRGGFGQLPATAALLGGLVAQEAIKLVTNQYMPMDNTVIVDLVKSSTKVLNLQAVELD